jgi:hypothetical protein
MDKLSKGKPEEIVCIRDIFARGYVCLDGGYIMEHPSYEHLLKLTNDEAALSILNMVEENESDTLCLYKDSSNEIKKYENSKGLRCIGCFYKLPSKFHASEFIDVSDKPIIEKLVGRIDSQKQSIRLGDMVKVNFTVGRVIWVNSGLYIYDDLNDQILENLDTDSAVEKICI